MIVKTPKLMVLSTQCWPIPARISSALRAAGFLVAAVSPSGSFLRSTSAVNRNYLYQKRRGSQLIVEAILDCAPDFLVCADDNAVEELHTIYAKATADSRDSRLAGIASLIETSLCAASSFDAVRRKSALIEIAESLGVRCPRTINVQIEDADLLTNLHYPVLIKADGSWGGKFVRLVKTVREARRTISEFGLPAAWPSLARNQCARIVPSTLSRRWFGQLRQICVQEFVPGPPANRAVVCWRGEVLAGVSVRVVETVYTFGPAAVVEVFDDPDMSAAANILVKKLNLSGFIGFDFVLDAYGRPCLIEMNPRVTPSAYLRLDKEEANLSDALFYRMTGNGSAVQPRNPTPRLMALFPQELQRSLRSDYITGNYDDVPWEEPALVLALLRSVIKPGAMKRWGLKRRKNRAINAALPHLADGAWGRTFKARER
jgi:hypothetical protein